MLKGMVQKCIDRMRLIQKDINRNDRVGTFDRSWGYVFTNLIKGAYYEFGMYKGNSFINSWKVYQRFYHWAQDQNNSEEPWRREAIGDYNQYQHQFYGFDSFEGIPDNNENNPFFKKGCYSCGYDEVNNRCKNNHLRYQLFQGYFSDLDPELLQDLQPAAIVNIDGDLYTSAIDALELIKSKLQQGTVVLMDDYNCFAADNASGERLALNEFCAKYPQFSFEPWFSYEYVGQAFLCHKKG